MELKPGTPEYQAEYDKEMKRLEADAGKDADKKADKSAEIPSDQKADKADKNADAKSEVPEEVKKELARLEKRIADSQRWGHENAAEVKRLKKEAEERKRREDLAEDPLLKANPGLEDTIKRVSQPVETKKPQEAWLETVARAVPDVEQLLGDKDFYAKAAAKKAEFGDEWNDPITAIRELSSIRTEHLSQKSVQVAVEAACKDFEKSKAKRTAMEVPGGSGGKDAGAQGDDAVKRYQTMSKAEFDKERSRVMGY